MITFSDERPTCEVDAAMTHPPRAPRRVDECADWLKTFLEEHGTTPSDEVFAAAAGKGYGRNLVKEAKEHLGVRVRRTGFGPGGEWVWYIVQSII